MFAGQTPAKIATGLGVVSFVLICAIIITNIAFLFSMVSEISYEGANTIMFFEGIMMVRILIMYAAPFLLVLMCVSDTWAAALTRHSPSSMENITQSSIRDTAGF